ncbi:MAG: efflux RND transporter periplasmic adaptor subunit [Phycisphaerae bacterium]|nr:efflux RND transporter periplasmic adaptor subunit [Phycisphaerae bacterium]
MIVRYVIPAIALVLLGFAVVFVVKTRQTWPRAAPVVSPPQSPYRNTVAGAGLIEAATENIAVGSQLAGVVAEVFVKVGAQVKAGDPLFRLDDRQMQAELAVGEATLASVRASLTQLEHEPRPEQVPVNEAQVRQAEADLADKEANYKRLKTLHDKGDAAEQEFVDAQSAFQQAQAKVDELRAQLVLLKAGTWERALEVQRAAVALAEAQVEQARTELERLTVRARVDGEVLQVDVRPGEFVGAPPGEPLIVLGDVRTLHVRVDIDEFDIPRFQPTAPARAMLKGHGTREFPLTFVRVEPYVIPKRSLTGESTERVDTRVLQVIYAIDTEDQTLFVGQQMDVFIDVAASATSAPAVPTSSE